MSRKILHTFLTFFFLSLASLYSTDRIFAYGIGTSPKPINCKLNCIGFSISVKCDWVPVHQYITSEAANIWSDPEGEIRSRASNLLLFTNKENREDNNCYAGYDDRDDILTGSKEEDEEPNLIYADCGGCGLLTENCAYPALNGFIEHFWEPDDPDSEHLGSSIWSIWGQPPFMVI